MATVLARRGYHLLIHAHRSIDDAEQFVEHLRVQGTDAIAQVADLTKQAEVEKVFAECHRHFGRLDAVVNCALIWERQDLSQVQVGDVRRHFEINTLGTFMCCQVGGQMMIEQPAGGAIINFGDWATIRPYEAYAAYFASKGAIPTMTRDFAIELARRNSRIRVNAVLPGPVTLPDELPPQTRRAAVESSLLHARGDAGTRRRRDHFSVGARIHHGSLLAGGRRSLHLRSDRPLAIGVNSSDSPEKGSFRCVWVGAKAFPISVVAPSNSFRKLADAGRSSFIDSQTSFKLMA